MSFSESLFLFELVVEDMKSWVEIREVLIKCQLADVFTMDLINPFKRKAESLRFRRKRFRYKPKDVFPISARTKFVQSILFEQDPQSFIDKAARCPMEMSLWSRGYPSQRLASAIFPWTQQLFNFLMDVNAKKQASPVIIHQEQNIFDEMTSRRVASIKLNIKISHLKERPKTSNIDEIGTVETKDYNLENYFEDPGTIKTIYSNQNNANKVLDTRKKRIQKKPRQIHENERKNNDIIQKKYVKETNMNVNRIPNSISRSETNINSSKQIKVLKSSSLANINEKDRVDLYKYIFCDSNSPVNKEVYWVNYFSIQDETGNLERSNSPSPSKTPDKASPEGRSLESCVSGPCMGRFKFKICDSECLSRKNFEASCSRDSCNELKQSASVVITKCKDVRCGYREHRKPLPMPDQRILIETGKGPCCEINETVEEITGNMEAKMNFGSEEDPCYCTCECKFGFTKKTTYCAVCGGFEKLGEDLQKLRFIDLPHPCPVYHKLEKKKPVSATGSDTKKKDKKVKEKPSGSGKSSDAEKEGKKSKKKKKDDRFKFNYGYQGIPPQIGHSQCAMPCTGTMSVVPKSMGWLWTADNVPGLKFRPGWKPGAVNKHVLRLLRIAKNPDEAFAKKRRDAGKRKRPLKRPLLIVHKKDGEYTVTMETMKTFAKPRTVSQYPYEDKPLITYTIGRTEEENRERQKKKDREKRRLERAQRRFIQSTFSDMCKDICLKTYQQALGILPFAEEYPCLCYPAEPDEEHANMNVSCSCSEDKSMTDSDTDLDEWVVEFTPPTAYFDQNQMKAKKIITADNSSQYTYLDYRVLLYDKLGNQVPRFFTGPDGKQQCSDLGGFWGPDKKWLEINVDGYIAPDSRWAPNNFFGPNGEQVDTDTGKFQAMNGKWLVVGIDGYIDKDRRWRFYPRPRSPSPKKKPQAATKKKGAGDKKDKKNVKEVKPSETAFSCFGDATPKYISELGKMGHGHDRKVLLAALRDLLARGESVKIPKPQTIPKFPRRKQRMPSPEDMNKNVLEDVKCKHATPSTKGIVAVDEEGNKVYFRLKETKNRRPKMRLDTLKGQGISLSSFHVPCLHSFINSEEIRRKHRENLANANAKAVGTQI